ncbi:MAG: glycoside hydrolase family 16 protein [Saprospiraceae bacterium]|nr:glycoside hydrolase family 16 protein [Saprospiraceae bacterium]
MHFKISYSYFLAFLFLGLLFACGEDDDTPPPPPPLVDDVGPTSPTSYPGMALVWSDEFDATSINSSDWNHEIGGDGWGNNESQYYTDRATNSFQQEGFLVIEAREEQEGTNEYTSARMTTQGKQEFQYGRIDIRARLPRGQGIWPALWMLGSNFSSVGWPKCGEIDIMEVLGHEPNKLYGTLHWEEDSNNSHAEFGGNTTLSSGSFNDSFHVFSVVWEQFEIKWLVDDVEYHSINTIAGSLDETRAEFFFIFNVAVGGNWPGYPDASTSFPQRMFVDYVRVFQ